MVDMPSLYSPSSPLGDPIMYSPLCGELIGDMQVLEDISQSLSDDTFHSLHMLDYQNCDTAVDSSSILGRAYRHTNAHFRTNFATFNLFDVKHYC